MRAMIFAAGRGMRMRPLTDTTPKPLLEVSGKPLIVWHLERLQGAGVREVIINTAHLAAQFPAALGDGSRWGLRIHYSAESGAALETGGGVLQALPLLGTQPFLLLSGDIWCDFDLATLPRRPHVLAHLVLVDNPAHHPDGDFVLGADGRVQPPVHEETGPAGALTFAGIAVCKAALFKDWRTVIGDADGARAVPPRFRLAPLLHAAARGGQLTAEHYRGRWTDVGTPTRLKALRAALRSRHAR